MHKICVLFLVALGAAAQEHDKPVDPAVPARPWKFFATVDSAYSDNLSHPAGGENLLHEFDAKGDAFSLSEATFGARYMGDRFGFNLNAGYGDVYEAVGGTDPWRGPNQYVGQLYFSYKPLHGNNLQIDAGKFYTSAGAEVVDVLENFNYSRSLVFVLGLPYYHFGVRASIPVTNTFTVGAQLLNGWNNVRDNNSGKTFGFTSSLARAKWGWSQTYLVGPEKTSSNQGYRHLYDAVFTAAPKAWVAGYAEVVFGFEHRAPFPEAGKDTGREHWSGAALAARFKPFRKLSFSPRWEFFDDATGFGSGEPQHLMEWTATADYHPNTFVTWRAEYRADHSDHSFFSGGAREASRHDQQTVLVALILHVNAER